MPALWSRRFLAAAVLLLGLLVPVGWVVGSSLAGPSDGTVSHAASYPSSRWRDGLVVSRVYGASPLREGDRVVAVDGVAVQRWVGGSSLPAVRRQIGDRLIYRVVRHGREMDLSVPLRRFPFVAALGANAALLAFQVVLLAVAAFVVVRRPRDLAARTMFALAVLVPIGYTTALAPQVIDFAGGRGIWPLLVGEAAWALVWVALLPYLALVFPTPPRVLAYRPWLAAGFVVVPLLLHGLYVAVTVSWAATSSERLERVVSISLSTQRIAPLVIAGLGWLSYRRLRDPLARRRLRPVFVTAAVALAASLVLVQIPSVLANRSLLPWPIEPLLFLLVPLAIATAILRYRLFDIEVILKRSLVYGGLTVVLAAVYVATVWLLDRAFDEQSKVVGLVAAGLVAWCFHPVRAGLRRLVGRLVYGQRDDPYEVVSRLSRVDRGATPQTVLSAVVDTIARALRLPFARIELYRPEENFHAAATYGQVRGHPVEVPITRGPEVVGRLLLDVGPGREPFGPADQRLLDDIARQVGGAAQVVLLTAALQSSRERLVTTREEERRRLRRDLHDGIGPCLAAAAMQLEAAGELVGDDPVAARQLIDGTAGQLQVMIGDIRRIVGNLRPAALDQLGLVGALRKHLSSFAPPTSPLLVTVEADDELDDLPAAVEVAAFRIVLEAVHNAARHSTARHCTAKLWRDGGVQIRVHDDGTGLPPRLTPGVGLSSIRERAAELGGVCTVHSPPYGGTSVQAWLPLPNPKESGDD